MVHGGYQGRPQATGPSERSSCYGHQTWPCEPSRNISFQELVLLTCAVQRHTTNPRVIWNSARNKCKWHLLALGVQGSISHLRFMQFTLYYDNKVFSLKEKKSPPVPPAHQVAWLFLTQRKWSHLEKVESHGQCLQAGEAFTMRETSGFSLSQQQVVLLILDKDSRDTGHSWHSWGRQLRLWSQAA